VFSLKQYENDDDDDDEYAMEILKEELLIEEWMQKSA